ncbi:MAG: LysR family transcriptional regulator [Clostridiales bacterium]|nr:LysR family transcriptional regulator [Clostridiales bacterium]
MEIRELKYFLAVAREENITRAADFLYVTQPSLTRQIQNMEKEVGQPLFIRAGRKMVLTEAGLLLRKRAEEILELYEKAEREWLNLSDEVNGEVYIGGGETYGMTILMDVIAQMRKTHPNIKIHIISGDMVDICERLDKGLIDFGLLMQPADLSKYENIRIPYVDRWGLLMHKDHPLVSKEYITPEDLKGIPIMQSRHSLPKSPITEWYKSVANIDIVGTYNLLTNAAFAAQAKIGCVLCIDKLFNTFGSDLVFKPLYPAVEVELDIVWKKYQVFSKSAQIFLKFLKEKIQY